MKGEAKTGVGVGEALLTDLYQITMAQGYWKTGRGEAEAVFHLFFRKEPFHSGFAIAAGLEAVVEFLEAFRFTAGDVEFLAGLVGNDGRALFESEFLEMLRELRLTCDVEAIPEGTPVFAHEPLLRIQGPILQCQLLETALLNLVNFQTLIATKAARICLAAQGEPVVEFGLRRAQGVDGAMAASRAAYIGGCAGTSNVLAGKRHGIPVRGTHAHSWVMSFPGEAEAFRRYAEALPNNCIFLVDTYDTLEGVQNAVRAGVQLRAQGHEMIGIRLDSGDLAALSIAARKILDDAGFTEAVIVASNDLDEHLIERLKGQGARISVWGVGTRLVTAYDQPALGGVYKLGAIRSEEGRWEYTLKLSEHAVKTSNPGVQQVRRFEVDGEFLGDGIYDELTGAPEEFTGVGLGEGKGRREFPVGSEFEDLLVPIYRGGRLVYALPSLGEIRERVRVQLGKLGDGVKRLADPEEYWVGLEMGLHDTKVRLMREARERVKV